MSKSSFLLVLFLVLLAAASLKYGGARLEKLGGDIRYEARAGFASLLGDVHEIMLQAESAPDNLKALWDDMRKDLRILKADATGDAHLAVKRISALIKTT